PRSRAAVTMNEGAAGDVTVWLERWSRGESAALEQLTPLVYDQLRKIADGLMHGERPGHTLQATALVHETFKQLIGIRRVCLNDRAHFYTFAAKLMRRILIDHARRVRASKRGMDFSRLPLNAELLWISPRDEETLDLSEAMDELERQDPL